MTNLPFVCFVAVGFLTTLILLMLSATDAKSSSEMLTVDSGVFTSVESIFLHCNDKSYNTVVRF